MSDPNFNTALSFTWPDRRPIGILWLVERQFVTEDNPHGITPNWAKRITNAVKNCKLIGAQGCYIHGGFTAKLFSTIPEWQNPLPLPAVWEDRIEGIGKLFREAGLRWGTTIKPYRPSGITDFVNDRIQYLGELSIDDDKVQFELRQQIDWCREQGMSLFYLDSPRGKKKKGGMPELNYSWFNKAYPDCLLMPEITSGMERTDPAEADLFKYGFPWSRAGGHSKLRKQGKFTVFAVDHLKDIPSLANQTDEQIESRITNNLEGGDIVAPFVWWESLGMRLLLKFQGGRCSGDC